MALSLLQDAQTARGLAAVRTLQGMNRDEERSLSVSPPLTGQRQQHQLGMNLQHSPSLYGGFHPATASAMGMFAPQLLAANQTAAALMAAGLPMSLRASLATGLPAMSGLSDHKSACGSESSDISMELAKASGSGAGLGSGPLLLHQKYPGLTLPLNFGPMPDPLGSPGGDLLAPVAAPGSTTDGTPSEHDGSSAAIDLRAAGSRSRTPQQQIISHLIKASTPATTTTTTAAVLPEQTEPEDLSMHSPRSPVSMEELDELDDAATLYLKQRQRQLLAQQHHRHGMES
uniref:Uncharacterized protein n=1 Tax=Anopheles albimanus TaxID=7167 RepID=A0A182FUR6_ANOAL